MSRWKMGRRTKTRRVGEQKGTKALTLSRTTGACTLLIEVKVIDCVRSILVFAYVLQVAAKHKHNESAEGHEWR